MVQSEYSIQPLDNPQSSTSSVLDEIQPSFSLIAENSSHAQNSYENHSQQRRYKLLRTARNLLPDERISDCQHALAPDYSAVVIEVDEDQPGAHFRNLVRCDSPQCPYCSAARSEADRHKLSVAMAQAQDMGYFPVMLSFTLRHKNRDSLDELQKALRTAFNKTFSGRWYQEFKERWEVVGKVTARECTYGKNGWHPHLHILMFHRIEIAGRWCEVMQAEISARWAEKLKLAGFSASLAHGVDVRTADSDIADYIAKFGREPIGKAWGADVEVAKSNVKRAHNDGLTPFQILGAAAGISEDLIAVMRVIRGDRATVRRKAGMLYSEFFYTMKGKARLHWGDMARILELDDALWRYEQANPEPERDTWAIALVETGDDWRAITGGKNGSDLRAELLGVCATRDAWKVREWLASHGITGGVPDAAFQRTLERINRQELLQ